LALSEAAPDNLGLACTDEGLLLGQTPLIERHDGRFAVRERHEIERLLQRAYPGQVTADRLMSGLATVAPALNANDPCLARIAAVHLKIPDLPSSAARDALAAEDSLIKYARDEGGGFDWNPALHPRTGTPPNPGWFAPTDSEHDDEWRVRAAQNNDDARRDDAAPPTADDEWVKIPPGKYIDELADFVQWIANARPADTRTIRAEIKRYYYDVGDANGGDALNVALSSVLQPGTTKEDRQATLNLLSHYARYDPAETGHLRDLLSGTLLLLLPFLAGRVPTKPLTVPLEAGVRFEVAQVELSAEERAAIWKLGWGVRGKVIDRIFRRGSLHELSRTIDDFVEGVAISNKSIDLNAATYQNFRRLLSSVNKYLDKLEAYTGTDWGGDEITLSQITGRALRLIIPKGSMTPIQREAIKAAGAVAKRKGFGLIVTEL
jgi:hypothetical protein